MAKRFTKTLALLTMASFIALTNAFIASTNSNFWKALSLAIILGGLIMATKLLQSNQWHEKIEIIWFSLTALIIGLKAFLPLPVYANWLGEIGIVGLAAWEFLCLAYYFDKTESKIQPHQTTSMAKAKESVLEANQNA